MKQGDYSPKPQADTFICSLDQTPLNRAYQPSQNPQHFIQFCEDKKLTIIDGYLVLHAAQKEKKITEKKRNITTTRVHSINVSEAKETEKIKQHNEDMKVLPNQIFSLNEYLEKLKRCSTIVIENCRANIYGLKKLIKLTSQNLTHLTINNCVFYEEDDHTLKKRNPISHNKMLQELNFTLQIKNLQLPQIESIDIKLQQGENNLHEQELKNQKINDEQIESSEAIAERFQCDIRSEFINFENNHKSKLERKYLNGGIQEELNYVISGKRNEDLSRQKDENTIKDIQKWVSIYSKYIKNSYVKNVLIIREDCLENPIALSMIQNVITLNQQFILTVIFKENGYLSAEVLEKAFDILISLKQLESLAFFCSEPEMGTYYLLKEYYSTKTFKFIILNRSNFDIEEFRFSVFGQQRIKDDEGKKLIQTPPNYYGFYIIDQANIFEFTPYEYCIKDILFPDKNFGGEEYEAELLKYQIGQLIHRQKAYTVEGIKKEISKYQDDTILTFQGISEQILLKYIDILGSGINDNALNQLIYQEQTDFEVEIHKLIKYYNILSNFTLQKFFQTIIDPFQKLALRKNMKIAFDEYNIDFTNSQEFINVFLVQQGFVSCNIQGYLAGSQYIGKDYLIKIKQGLPGFGESQTEIRGSRFSYNNIEKYFKQVGHLVLTLSIEFQEEKMQFETQDFQNQCITLRSFHYDKVSQQKEFYNSKRFFQLFETILQHCQTTCSISLSYLFENHEQFLQNHFDMIEKSKHNIAKLTVIQNGNVGFENYKLPSRAENVQLLSSDIKKEFFKKKYDFKTFGFCGVDNLEQLEFTSFKNLQKIQFLCCGQIPVEQMIEYYKQSELPEKNLCVDILIQETNLSLQSLNSILTQQSKIKFRLSQLDPQQKECLQQIINEKSLQSQLNWKALNKFYGINTDLERITKINNQQGLQDSKNLEIPQKTQTSQKSYLVDIYKGQQIKGEYKNTIQVYLRQPSTKIKSSILSNNFQTSIKFFKENLSDCCKSRLCGEVMGNHQNANLLGEMNKHYGEFCLFKSSMFQSKLCEQKLKIIFLKSVFTNKYFIHNLKEMENILKLDFSNSVFVEDFQIRFVNILIQLSPKLKVLDFSNIKIQEDLAVDISPIKNQHLSKLKLLNSQIEFVLLILESIKEVRTLQSLNIKDVFHKQYVENILENNKITLRKLSITIHDQDCYECVAKCQNLEKLTLTKTNESQISSIFSINKQFIQQIKELNLYTNERFISKEQFINFLEQTNTPNLQRINLLNEGFEYNSTFQTFYRSDQNRNSFQALRICDNFYVQVEENSGSEIKKINLEEFIRSQYPSFQKLVFSIKSHLIPKQLHLRELYIQKQPANNYRFLNSLFDQCKNSLTLLSLTRCGLTNNSFIGVNFSKLPKTIKYLDFGFNIKLSSLDFLKPVLRNMKEYKINQIEIRETSMRYDEIKQVNKSLKHNLEFDYIYESQTQMENSQLIKYEACSWHNQFQNKKMLFNQLFQEKIIDSSISKELSTYFIPSPLSLVTVPLRFQSDLIELNEEQLQDQRFTLRLLSGNKYLWWCGGMINENHQYVLGYSKKYHGILFYHKFLHESCGQDDFSSEEHAFYDYLLLLKLQERQQNIKQMHIYLKLEVSDELMNQQKYRKKLKDDIQKSQQKIKEINMKVNLRRILQKRNKKEQEQNKKDEKGALDQKDRSDNQQIEQTIKENAQDVYESIESLQFDDNKITIEKNAEKSNDKEYFKWAKREIFELEEKQYKAGKELKKQLNQQKIEELKMIEYLNRIPPSEIVIKNRSVQFIKIWYMINSISPLVYKTNIQCHEPNSIQNSSIGNYFTKNLHKRNFLYQLFHTKPNKYRYDNSILFLAQDYKQSIQNLHHLFLSGLFPFYIFVCLFGVFFFSVQFDVSCGSGISWYSYICYLGYALLSLLIEFQQFKKCLTYVSHLVPQMEINLQSGFVDKIINSIKQYIDDTPWINQWLVAYSIQFLQSQIARFELFTNISFLYSIYSCGDDKLFYITIIFISIPFLYSLFQLWQILLHSKKSYELPTYPLDVYYKLCNINEFKAVSNILDLVSPSNVTQINGKLFNSGIITSFIKILGKSIPLVIIQIYNLSQKELTSSLIISLVSSILSLLILLNNFLTITPSTLNQEDFNKLNEEKLFSNSISNYEQRLQEFENETFVLRFYTQLKQIRSNYLQEKMKGVISWVTFNQYTAHLKYITALFDTSKDQLEIEIEKQKEKKKNQ